MEKKKLNRIVGILVFVAAVIVILPLVISRNGPADKTLSVEAPPFPSSESNAPPMSDKSSDSESVPPSSMPSQSSLPASPPESSADQPPAVNPPSSAEPATVPSSPTSTSEETTSAPTPAAPATPEPAQTVSPDKPEVSMMTSSVVPKKAQSVAGAWAVQMGNFHNHSNAIRLANRLRTAGYNAFTRQVVSRTGAVSTRVYVGPETIQASARKLSAHIQSHLKLNGMVVPFEPLAL